MRRWQKTNSVGEIRLNRNRNQWENVLHVLVSRIGNAINKGETSSCGAVNFDGDYWDVRITKRQFRTRWFQFWLRRKN